MALMLCDKCSSILLQRRDAMPPSEAVCIPDTFSNTNLYYLHYESLLVLEQFKDKCHLCRKMWDAFKEEIRRSRYNSTKNFDSDLIYDSSPVYLCVLFKDEWTSRGEVAAEKSFAQENLDARCADLRIYTSFAPNIEGTLNDELGKLGTVNEDSVFCLVTHTASILSDSTTVSAANLDLARIWFKNCYENHKPCQKLSIPCTLPLRVIDLSNPRKPFLAAGRGRNLTYATLSYKWGMGKKFLTTTGNISQLQHRIPTEELPCTFTDAIQVASELGFSYLWIDALCIQHDLEKEKNAEIARMGEIYSVSSLTIFAGAGEMADSGLATTRDASIIKPSKVQLKVVTQDWTHEGEYFIRSFRHNYYPEMPLFHRGWVLQEEISSARALIFGQDEIAWRCLCETSSERQPGCIAVERLENLDLHPRDKFMNMRFWLRTKDPPPMKGPTPDYSGRGGVLDEWYKLVENFSSRQLTLSSDVLPALSGIASKISQLHELSFVAGLWREDLQLGLLWHVDPGNPKSENENPHSQSLKATFKASKSLLAHCSNVPSLIFPRKVHSVDPEDTDTDNWEIVSPFGNPSWSWISQFRSSWGIRFDHYRKYIFEKKGSLEVLDV